MDKKLIILKDVKNLSLVKGEVLDFNSEFNTFTLKKVEENTDVAENGTNYSYVSKFVEISDAQAAKLIDADKAELELIYPEPQVEEPVIEHTEETTKFINMSDEDLVDILNELDKLTDEIGKLKQKFNF